MRRIIVVANNFYALSSEKINIGGVETYIKELISCLHDEYDFIVVQPGQKDLDLIHEGAKKKQFFRRIEKEVLAESDILFFSTEQWAHRTMWKQTVIVQHGIYWDLPVELYSTSSAAKMFPFMYKLYDIYRNYNKVKYFNKIVCVDFIYPIWYKTIFSNQKKKFTVIPNFASFRGEQPKLSNHTKNLRFLFARRFVDIRGIDLAIDLAKFILHKFPGSSFHFVGDGPKKKSLVERLHGVQGVSIYSAQHEDMKETITTCDVVLIPSLGSEGTSLIAIEAMALGKTVIASSVGGLTNIIINGFNGFLCDAELDSFLSVINKIYQDPRILDEVGRNAFSVANVALSKDRWQSEWRNYLNDI